MLKPPQHADPEQTPQEGFGCVLPLLCARVTLQLKHHRGSGSIEGGREQRQAREGALLLVAEVPAEPEPRHPLGGQFSNCACC